ncbi:MAG: peptidylprolyl isomerase [Clostridia bacterium]|nr:peptidylprolyl isomerase [Clostridia bacterium]
MDKKKSIAIIVIAVVMVVLVIAVLATSHADDSALGADELVSIGENVYTVKECKDYIKITNEAAGDITKATTDEEKEEIINQFLSEKIYAHAAAENGITVPEEEIQTFKKDYTEKAVYAENGISEEEYLRYATDNYLYTQLSQNLEDYYELPDEYYDAFVESVEDPMKSYSFRVMTFYYEEPKSGDASGDVSGEAVEQISGELLRDAVYAKAENVRNQVINGGDFEKLAQENSSYRYTFNGSSYTLVNGNLEYAVSVLLQDKLGSEALYNAVKDLKSGECSALVEDTEANVINFVKVETVEDGFTGEANEEVREILLYQYQDTLVTGDAHYHMNQTALLKVYYQ